MIGTVYSSQLLPFPPLAETVARERKHAFPSSALGDSGRLQVGPVRRGLLARAVSRCGVRVTTSDEDAYENHSNIDGNASILGARMVRPHFLLRASW
jgi:hypothetical protein